jgi:hypothetical protein
MELVCDYNVPIFGGTTHGHKFASPWLSSTRGGLIYSTKKGQGWRTTRGGAPLWPTTVPPPNTAATRPPLRRGNRLSPLGRHFFISSTLPLPHLHYNLLANTIFDAIYYFPMIYCVAMSSFEWLPFYGNGDIVCLMVAYMFVIFYDDLMHRCMSAHICSWIS